MRVIKTDVKHTLRQCSNCSTVFEYTIWDTETRTSRLPGMPSHVKITVYVRCPICKKEISLADHVKVEEVIL